MNRSLTEEMGPIHSDLLFQLGQMRRRWSEEIKASWAKLSCCYTRVRASFGFMRKYRPGIGFWSEELEVIRGSVELTSVSPAGGHIVDCDFEESANCQN